MRREEWQHARLTARRLEESGRNFCECEKPSLRFSPAATPPSPRSSACAHAHAQRSTMSKCAPRRIARAACSAAVCYVRQSAPPHAHSARRLPPANSRCFSLPLASSRFLLTTEGESGGGGGQAGRHLDVEVLEEKGKGGQAGGAVAARQPCD